MINHSSIFIKTRAINTAASRSSIVPSPATRQGSDAWGCTLAWEWLVISDNPHLILKADLRIAWTNRAARSFLSQIGLELDPDGNLRSTKIPRRKLDAFRAAVAEAIAVADGWPDNIHVVPFCEHTATALHLYRLVASDDVVFGGAIITKGLDSVMIERRLEEFSLTETEKRIVLSLMNGLTVSDISKRTGSTLLTVRTHIKRIYEKMGVNSREKLFAQLTRH